MVLSSYWLTRSFIGQPLFPGESGVDQLVEIIKVVANSSAYHFIALLISEA